MNARERFLAIMSFEPADRTLLWEMGYLSIPKFRCRTLCSPPFIMVM